MIQGLFTWQALLLSIGIYVALPLVAGYVTRKWIISSIGIFIIVYFLPIETSRVQGAILEAFHILKEYAQEHVLFCLVPAFFIAGAISVFINQTAVMKYFGGQAKKILSYSVASVSGTILAVCSCTVLPIFAGIYKRGAGIGPATTFLYIFNKLSKKQSCLFNQTRHKICYKLFVLILNERFHRGICL